MLNYKGLKNYKYLCNEIQAFSASPTQPIANSLSTGTAAKYQYQ